MFIQTIQGQVARKASVLQDGLDQWVRDLSPGAEGWLGSTSGVTSNGEFISLMRFETPEAARRNSQRPEQHQWWMDTAKQFSGEVIFHDCERVDLFAEGGSDEAGFVQVIQGKVRDVERMRELDRQMETAGMGEYRPDVLGGTVAWHGDGGYTMAIYFASEREARQAERKEPTPAIKGIFEEQQSLHVGQVRYLDLSDPWLHSPMR